MHRFSNNAESTLADALPIDALVMTLSAGGGALFDVFVGSEGQSDGSVQAATLTSLDVVGAYEIVYMYAREDDVVYIDRGQEETEPREWPAGTKVSANVTRGMLENFAQKGRWGEPVPLLAEPGPLVLSDLNENAVAASSAVSGLVFNAHSRMRETWTFGGYSVLQQAQPHPNRPPRRALAYECIGSSTPVDIGDTPRTWLSGQAYRRGAVVIPSVPNGRQYWPEFESLLDDTTVDSVEPDFDGWFLGVESGREPTGSGPVEWLSQEMPAKAQVFFPTNTRLMLTEVGFLCSQYDASAPPAISVGTQANPTLVANAVSLTGLVVGEVSTHRILIAAGGVAPADLLFTAVTGATGGTCRGAFYWKGFIFETTPEIS